MTIKTLLSTLAVNYFGFTMAVDYSIVLLSIDELWKSLGGSSKLYGFVFGSYALTQALISPLLGYVSDVRGLKFALILSLLLNAVGNVIYGLAVVVSSVYMVLFGRVVSGIGAGALALGVVYLTNTSSRDSRGKAIASFKLSQAIGYLGGPLLGMAMVSLSKPSPSSNIAAMTFNFYTAPAWLALGNVMLIVLPLVKFCFKNPLSPHMALKYNHREAKELVGHTVVLMVLLFLATTCFWAITGDLFTIAFGQYHLFDANEQLWKLYVSAGAALGIATIIVRLTIQRRIMSPVIFTFLGLLFIAAGFSCLADYTVQGKFVSRVLYYTGLALSTSGSACFFTGIGTYYSQKVTDLSHQARNRRGFFLGLFNLAEALGRAAGPTLASVVMYIERNPASNLDCDVEQLIPGGCRVSNVNVVVPVAGGLIVLLVGVFAYYHFKHGKCRTDVSLLSLEELEAGPYAAERRMSIRESGDGEEGDPQLSEVSSSRSPSRTSLSLCSKASINTIHTV